MATIKTATAIDLMMQANQPFINAWAKKMMAQISEPIFDEIMNHKHMPDWRHGRHPKQAPVMYTVTICHPAVFKP